MNHPYGSTEITHIVFILDSSGSMGAIRDEAIELFNAQVSEVRAATAAGRTTVSFATFGFESRPIIHYVGAEIGRLEPLTHATYQPNGSTPMLDAIGWMAERVEQELVKPEEDYSVLVVIVSDGRENYSGRWQQAAPAAERHRAYDPGEIRQLITRLEATGRWTFTFLGANMDLHEIIDRLGFKEKNVSDFRSDKAGMEQAKGKLASASRRYMEQKKSGLKQVADFYGEEAPPMGGAGVQAAPLEMPRNHVVAHLDGGRWLIDTGAPFSFGRGPVSICGRRFEVPGRMPDVPMAVELDSIAPFVGGPLDGLLGMDVLDQFSLVLDPQRGQARFGGGELDAMPGLRVPLDMRLRSPLLEVEIEGRRTHLFWDTAAMASYLNESALNAAWPLRGRMQDFHPLLGVFETELREAPVRIAGLDLRLTFGRLSDLLSAMLAMTGAQGVLGNELLSLFTLGFDPFRSRLILR